MAETWAAALKRHFDANKLSGKGPTNIRQLSRAIEGNPETWRREINRTIEKNRATPSVAAAISEGLAVPLAELPPPAKAPTGWELQDRLEELAGEAVTTQDIAPVMRALWLLAEGKRAEALRVLSEAEDRP